MVVQIEKLQKAFNTMTYGENIEDTSKANEWLKTTKIDPKTKDEIEQILEKAETFQFTPTRAQFIRLAKEIENNASLICQIEILSRGVLSKDTKKAVESLAQYFYYHSAFIDDKAPKGHAVGVFGNDHPIWLLGLFLAPALAAGKQIVLHVGTTFAVIASFILDLAIKAGLPNQALTLIPCDEIEPKVYFQCNKIRVVALFIELLNSEVNPVFIRNIISFLGYKSPMLVFDNADLDSAAECAVQAAWSYQGMLPWSVGTILVQENVFKKFTEKLKSRLDSVRFGNGDDKLADFSYPTNPKILSKLSQTVNKARAMGIEVYQKDTSDVNGFKPTLIIGMKPDTNPVLSAPVNDSTVTVLPFRTIDEGVNLASNSVQGLAASIWSENIGLINEVAQKLVVGNVWINAHGLFSPDLPLTPLKGSGKGHFGGKQAELEYKSLLGCFDIKDVPQNVKTVDAVISAISAGKKASAAWSRTPILNRLKVFTQLSESLNAIDDAKLKNVIDDLKQCVDSVMLEARQFGVSSQSGFTITSLKQPVGTILIDGMCLKSFKLLISALFEGNAVILLTKIFTELYQAVSKQLPTGLFTVLYHDKDEVPTALRQNNLDRCFLCCSRPFISEHKKVTYLLPCEYDWEQTFNQVTVCKNIWSNVGGSSQCNL